MAKLVHPDNVSALLLRIQLNAKESTGCESHYNHYQARRPHYVARNPLQWQYAAMNGIRALMAKPDPLPANHFGDGYIGTHPTGFDDMVITRLNSTYPALDFPPHEADSKHNDFFHVNYSVGNSHLHAYTNKLKRKPR